MTPNASINVSVSNHYREPTYEGEIISQGLLGQRLEIIEQMPLFTRIRQSDCSISWVRYNSLRQADDDFNINHLKTFVSVNRYPARETNS